MQPFAEQDISSYIYDDFTSSYPWRGYWAARLAETGFATNEASNTYHSYRPNNWTIGSGLVIPRSDPASIAGTLEFGHALVIKMRKIQPPFKFEIAWKWSVLRNDQAGTNRTFTINTPYMGNISVANSANQAYLFIGSAIPGLSGLRDYAFSNGTHSISQDCYYYFDVTAGLVMTWDLLVNGARPTGSGSWTPGTTKTATSTYTTQLNSSTFGSLYVPVFIRPIFGGTLEYLEVRMK